MADLEELNKEKILPIPSLKLRESMAIVKMLNIIWLRMSRSTACPPIRITKDLMREATDFTDALRIPWYWIRRKS